jgi:hypothetical protein
MGKLDNSLAVVGFMIEICATNDPLLNKVLPYVTSIPHKGDHTDVGPLSFTALATTLKNNNVYR